MARSSFAASFDPLATEILAELFTHTIKLRRSTFTRANPWEAPTAESVTEQTGLKAAVLGPGTRRYNGELIEADHRVVYVDKASVTLTVDTETVVVIDDEEHALIMVTGYPEGANASLLEITVKVN